MLFLLCMLDTHLEHQTHSETKQKFPIIQFLWKYWRYLLWISVEQVFVLWWVIMIGRAIRGKIMWIPMTMSERICYLGCGVSDFLSLLIPILIYTKNFWIFQDEVNWDLIFQNNFRNQLFGASIWYVIFTSISWVFYILGKPQQLQKLRKYFKW